ncbi:RIP metalloprotease RseP [Hyalangium rubrum]|uniref:RIP metalloprotease RseP n=1 Tax=Hyalangium rubrum TaxID=3103134 RepID=A0ABU5GWE4_9BACT|nr:RIP metalloprotease RseP [Hyalangium sp. s54d21]MDY7225361.1 RIP metalloprotease RseP [Hyalangium sp. s54d21]
MFQSLGFFALLLGVLVTVHELGHFLVAKACGVKVLKFSLGFGPKLLSFTKGETEYQLALLPLGGYVKMAGDIPGEELAPEEASRGFLAQPPWKRMAIVIAGPAFNLIFPVIIYFFVFLGDHQAVSTRLGYVMPDSPAAKAGLHPGDVVVAVDGERVRTYEEMRDAFVDRFERPIPITVERDKNQSIIMVTPMKRVESSPIETIERGVMGVEVSSPSPVVGVPPGSAAEQAGLKTFDRILAINGTLVPDEATFYQVLDKHQGALELTVQRSKPVEAGAVTGHVPEVVKLRVEKQADKQGYAALGVETAELYLAAVTPGSPAEKAGLRSGDRLVAFNGKPLGSFSLFAVELTGLAEKPFELTWRGKEGERKEQLAMAQLKVLGEAGETQQLGLGVQGWIAERAPAEKVTVNMGWGEALQQSAKIVPTITKQTVKAIAGLVTRDVPLSSVGGPIMMYQMASRSSELGWDYFLNLMAIISINLGVMNLLPIPILDGFHLVAAGWEAIRRRPIPVRVREVANVIGLAMLVALMLVAMFNDITR